MSKCQHYGCNLPAASAAPVCKAHLVRDLRSEGYRISDDMASKMSVEELLNYVDLFESEVAV
jgi:hypothetical protein